MQNKHKIDIDKLKETPIHLLEAIVKEGESHIKYFYGTMKVFKYPEKRIKCYDTTYFEEALPIIKEILSNKK